MLPHRPNILEDLLEQLGDEGRARADEEDGVRMFRREDGDEGDEAGVDGEDLLSASWIWRRVSTREGEGG